MMNNWRSADRSLLLHAAALLIAAAALTRCGSKDAAEADHSAHQGGHAGMEMPAMTAPVELDTNLDATLRAPNTFVVADLETVKIEHRELSMDLSSTGLLTYDPRSIRSVSARAAGWIEKLHVKYRYQPVRQGQPLMELYSRELVTEQENFLFLSRQGSADPGMLASAERRLSLLGFTEQQIADLRASGKVQRAVTYYSPAAGHLHENDGAGTKAPDAAMTSSSSSDQGLSLREGAYVEKGQTLFTIYGTHTVLALLNIHPADGQDRIAVGQRVSVSVDGSNGLLLEGTVDLVEPIYREGTSVVSVRVYLPNSSDSLRIGSRISGIIHTADRSVRAVPASAVVSTGLNTYVFVKENGGFRSRSVITGVRSGEWIELRSGISEQDAIAGNAQLLIDSEGFLKLTSP